MTLVMLPELIEEYLHGCWTGVARKGDVLCEYIWEFQLNERLARFGNIVAGHVYINIVVMIKVDAH